MPAQPVFTTWKVENLKPFHLQSEFFGTPSDEDVAELDEAVQRNGIRPLDIIVDPNEELTEASIGTIIAGHRRRYVAMHKRKWEEVPVCIRYDLMEQGPEAIEQYFLDSNTANRRLSVLQTVRAYERGKELETQRRKADPSNGAHGRVRDVAAKRLGLKARQLEDQVKILTTPPTIQQAVDTKRMTLKDGLRVAKATPEQQERIASMIDRGDGAKYAIQKVLGSTDTFPKDATAWERRWRDIIRIARQLLKGREASLQALLPGQLKGLTSLVRLVSQLLEAGLIPAEAAAVPSQAAPDTGPPDPGDETSGSSTGQAEPAKKKVRVVPKAQPQAKAG